MKIFFKLWDVEQSDWISKWEYDITLCFDKDGSMEVRYFDDSDWEWSPFCSEVKLIRTTEDDRDDDALICAIEIKDTVKE